MSIAYFPEDLSNRLAALEMAAERYEPNEFRDGVLFGLSLVRLGLGLGLETALSIPILPTVVGGERKFLEERRRT